ncbi:AMP-binding protein [Bombella saccharophila]|uniref:AMP-binding protein n=1 Tax=Bombella saccharophila TaxID=2967338 RepID=A0ABT3W780_9PROT|nr:AMP-binding protein [Bombella saccharophila]MCX5614648.1 AMP-binding protein [Bombella saccharophila]
MHASFDLSLITAPARPIFYTMAGPISGEQLLSFAWALADHWPERPIINLHTDPLHFTIVFLTSLLKGQYCILSSNHAASQLLTLQKEHNALCSSPTALPEELVNLSLPPLATLKATQSDNPHLAVDYKAAYVFTSGSTGQAKMHVKYWGELVARSHAALPLLAPHHPTTTTMLGTVPPYHMYGFETLILQSLHTHTATASGPSFFPRDVEKLAAHIPTEHTLITTPVHLRSLTTARIALPEVRRIISASAPLPHDLALEAETLFHAPVMEIYGSTETGSIASRRTINPDPWQLYDGVTLTADPTSTDAEAYICTAPYATPHPLNDIITQKGPRHFTLMSRKGDLLKIAGKRTSYGALNKALLQLDGVLDGCFAPLFSEAELQNDKPEPTRLQAFIVSSIDDTTALMRALRHYIDPAFMPRRLVRLPHLPRNAIGKLTRHAWESLIRDYAEKRSYPPFSIPATHPALPGHFPQNPTVPGIVLLEEVFTRLKLKPHFIENVKFLSIVRPEEPLHLLSSALGDGRIRFSLHHHDGHTTTSTILRGTAKGPSL